MSNPGELKGDVINDAYSELRISGLTVDPTPADLELALSTYENMMAYFKARSICAGYSFEDEPDPNTPHNVDRAFWTPMASNLAIRLVPNFNKEEHRRLTMMADSGLSTMSGVSAKNLARQVVYPDRQPRGSGNTLRTNRWARWYRDVVQAPSTCATIRMIIGDIDNFVEHFDSYLKDGEAVASYTIEGTNGLDVTADSLTSPDISYTVEALGAENSTTNSLQQVKIVATTDAGRVETRLIDFELEATNEF